MIRKINFYNNTKLMIDDSILLLLENIFSHIKSFLNLSNYEIELNIIFDSKMKKINNEYRKTNKTTDVLSFSFYKDLSINLIGCILISSGELRKISKLKNQTISTTLIQLFIHGVLHILGYDHGEKMSELENLFIAKIII